ncbi:HlyD family secretion protein [Sphingomonas paucimobilis]|uniref:HlyD family efflux transporter periplasmic adaptor subunit n=1 Tax=Sphingomonas paucimobilis TaxID=13689 RepID=A0A7Y2PA70_SPHPI|nr:HlyD family efflux transporter periplasmic adaptor subunit [Sphingomonas paucimobilis]EPE61883.1 hlyD secretion family protein [Exiguobacterium sp. S17]NNG56004.1 HlyD family efflux transporter periplasmic adaptor subunit [Sphingomonas paucimobilis]
MLNDDRGTLTNGSVVNQSIGTDLFRPEALLADADGGAGQPIARLPVSWGLLTMSMGTMLAGCVGFLMLGTYARQETARGLVSGSGGEIRIAAPAAGVVRTVLVVDGQRVRADQMLVTVHTLHTGVNGRPVDQALLDSLDRELVDMRARLRALGEAARIETEGLPGRFAALKGELAAASAQEQSASDRLRLAQESLARIEPVAARGFISSESLRHHREEVLVLQQAIADARGAKARIEGQIRELSNLAMRQPMTVAQQRGELLDLIARTQRDRDIAAGQRGFAVTAPASGVVTTVQVAQGQPVDPQQTLMTVTTKVDALLAEIFVPSRAIGFLAPGQEVRLRFDAFPYQRFGVGTGRVRTISSTVLRPDQIVATIHVEEPVYRVVVALDQDAINAYGQRYRIRSGMALSADIVLDRRSFAQWLLDPIKALRGRL